jgi:predicted Zn-dependent protease with MMP-like domain
MTEQIKPDSDSPPSPGEIEVLAQQVLATLPEQFRRQIRDVVIRVVDFPDSAIKSHLRLRSGYDLLGLYHGTSLLHKSVMYPQPDSDMIYLYREPILAFCRTTGQPLEAVVRNVLIHEIGHHFGFSDEDMERLEREG